MRSNSTAPGNHKSQADSTGVVGGLRKLQFLRRKTVEHLRIRQPLMEENTATDGVCSGTRGACGMSNCSSSLAKTSTIGRDGLEDEHLVAPATTIAMTSQMLKMVTPTPFITTATTTTSNYYNNRNSSSGSFNLDDSNVEDNKRFGGVLLVTTTAVHSNANTCTYNHNNKMADEAV